MAAPEQGIPTRRTIRLGRVLSALVRESHPGHYLTNLLHFRIATKKRRENLEFMLRWVAGHQDVTGNEHADTEAKLVATAIQARTGSSSAVKDAPSQPTQGEAILQQDT